MKITDAQLRTLLEKWTMSYAELTLAKVVSVNETELTCVVEMLKNETEYQGVRLRSVIDDGVDGIYAIPEVDSIVVVGELDNNRQAMFVVKCSSISKYVLQIGNMSLIMDVNEVVFNGGNYGGLIKVSDLVSKINRIEDKLKSHQHVYINAAAVATLTTPASAFLPPDTTLVFTNTTVSDIENEEVKH